MKENKKTNEVMLSELKPGGEFQLAGRTFLVLEHSKEGTAVISKGFWGKSRKFGDGTNYKESGLKSHMENGVLPELEKAVGAENILKNEADFTSVCGKNEFGTVICKVRPLTFLEVRKYTDIIENRELDDWWWTCTPWSTEERGWKYSVAVVSPSGCIVSNVFSRSYGVRPFCILKSDLFVSF